MPPVCWGWAQLRLSLAWWSKALSLPAELGGMCQVSLNVRFTLGSCCVLPATTACPAHEGLWCGAALGRHPCSCTVGNQSREKSSSPLYIWPVAFEGESVILGTLPKVWCVVCHPYLEGEELHPQNWHRVPNHMY